MSALGKLKSAVKKALPVPPIHGSNEVDRTRAFRRVIYFGRKHQCPVCESTVSRFLPSPRPYRRLNAMCPVCGSMEWHRLGWWLLSTRHADSLRPGSSVLHIAAEVEIRKRIQAHPGVAYIALDIADPQRATAFGDLLNLPARSGSLDLVYCSHVLEHVDDDIRALEEIRRVVKPGGAALLQVPVNVETTWGDPSITDPEERKRLFGQKHHVRNYGKDFADIVRNTGWNVEHIRGHDLGAEAIRYGLPSTALEDAADVFWCTPK